MLKSPLGYAFQGIRQNPQRLEAIGVPVNRYRVFSIAISGMFCGVAGCLHAIVFRMVVPELLNWATTGEVLIMCIVGGMGTFSGPLVGAAIITILHQLIGPYVIYWQAVIGLTLIFLLFAAPMGVMGVISKWFSQVSSKANSS